MVLFLFSSFFIFSIFSLSLNFTHPLHLLSLKCTLPSSNQTNPHFNIINPMQTLIDNLTSDAPKSQLTTSNTTFGHERYTGLVQCRFGLGSEKCTLCAKTARNTISSLCRYSNAVSAWFDGCYVQIISVRFYNNAYMNTSNHSCSGRVKNQDPARFAPALGTLLLKLRADVNIATHHGFSHGEIAYENIYHSESKIYGLVECVRSLSPQECDSCVEKAIEKLEFYCRGENGGFVVYGPCLVRFDSGKFYDGGGVINYAGVGVTGNFTVWEGKNENEDDGCKKKMVMAYWGGGVACFLVFVLLVYLLKRTVLNRAKVGALGFAEFDENSR